MLLTSNHKALRKWQLSEALVPANRLVGVVDGIERVIPDEGVTYVHLLFDQHEIVKVDGAWSESFRASYFSLNMIGDDGREEVFRIFPELKTKEPESIFAAVRESFYTGRANQLARSVAKFGMH